MLTIFAADIPSLGRVDASMLTETQRMQLFFTPDNVKRVEDFLGRMDDDACNWVGVACYPDGKIEFITWVSRHFELEGELNFSMLPLHLKAMRLVHQSLRGDINTQNLPQTMEFLSINACDLTGTLDLGALPRSLVHLNFVDNKISGVTNVANLPTSLKSFHISEPNISLKSLRIGVLPPGRLELRFAGCWIDRFDLENKGDAERVLS